MTRQGIHARDQWALTGAAVGALLPVCMGIYSMRQHDAYISSLGPNEVACGMGALSSMILIFIVGPICGVIGLAVGWAVSGVGKHYS